MLMAFPTKISGMERQVLATMRNDAGFFEEGRALWYEHGLDALTMEALACRDGLITAQQAGVQKVWLIRDGLSGFSGFVE